MKPNAYCLLFAATALTAFAQTPTPTYTAATLPTGSLLSEPGPTFRVSDEELGATPTFVTYGDQRFTDPANTRVTDPKVRQWLVAKIAQEHPAALILNGDVPYAGNVKNDYAVFQVESKPWRDAHVRVYPALGNHEFHGDPQECLNNWWTAFPEMKNRRWYSVQLGSRVYVIALDSDTSLLPGSDQARWLEKQISGMPGSVDFVVLAMHHPPVADVQEPPNTSHNPRANEIALRDYLTEAARESHARFLVSAGHIHNYERTMVEGVTYLVSGGGAARPAYVQRTASDLYQSLLFPNYHYVKLTLEKDRLHAVMYRITDPEVDELAATAKDTFDIEVKSR